MFFYKEIIDKIKYLNINQSAFGIFFTYISKIDEPSYSSFVKKKFFFIKNYLFYLKKDEEQYDLFLDKLEKAQKIYLSLLKFKQIVLNKIKKNYSIKIDLQFNELDLQNKNCIELIHENKKFLFNIYDLIKIINSSLSYEFNFFCDPKLIKNPWDNLAFSKSNLYNMYLFMKNMNINIPILFYRFFLSNLNLKTFLNNNQLIIKKFIIDTCHNFDDNKKFKYIKNMLTSFNTKRKEKISISCLYTKKYIVSIFEKYLKIYLNSVYSYEQDIRIISKIKLNNILSNFKKEQPMFGRKIICSQIKKLYHISKLKEKNNYFLFLNCYIPKSQFIFVSEKCFLIEYKEKPDQYSIFPMSRRDSWKNTIDLKKVFSLVKNYKFLPDQIKFIKNNPIVENKTYNNNFNDIDSDSDDSFDNIFISPPTYRDVETSINSPITPNQIHDRFNIQTSPTELTSPSISSETSLNIEIVGNQINNSQINENVNTTDEINQEQQDILLYQNIDNIINIELYEDHTMANLEKTEVGRKTRDKRKRKLPSIST